ncbi:chemotaxis protein [Babesia caballi]|uniref:Chemotaxis protein n=1 Tax=Babesia caballi TaxID=5871 RepID=A0AAV4LZ40_BABCB|nr:chemotaxis protein [Babesia caballi]
MPSTTSITAAGSGAESGPNDVPLSEVYGNYYTGPKKKLLKKCAYCTTPMRYFINNLEGYHILIALAAMGCGPIGVALISSTVVPHPPENPLAWVNWSVTLLGYYGLGLTTAGFLLFGDGMRLVMLADKLICYKYYARMEENGNSTAAAAATPGDVGDPTDESVGNPQNTELDTSGSAVIDMSSGSGSSASSNGTQRQPETAAAPRTQLGEEIGSPSLSLQARVLRLIFKFRTNNVMVDGKFQPVTWWQWVKRATWMERLCHILIPMRWLAASCLIAAFYLFNVIQMLIDTNGMILHSAFHMRLTCYLNGVMHLGMFYTGWRLFAGAVQLTYQSKEENLRPDFLKLFHNIPDGLQYLSDPKYAFVMDRCPCSYSVPDCLALPPAYEQSTHFHSACSYIFKHILVYTVFFAVIVSVIMCVIDGVLLVVMLKKFVEEAARIAVENAQKHSLEPTN